MTKNTLTIPNLKIKTKKSYFLLLPLFINYLMKSGKKTRALYILEKSLHLFSHLLLKKKLPYFTKSFLAFSPVSFKINKEKNQNSTIFEYSKFFKIQEKRNVKFSSFFRKNIYNFLKNKNRQKESVNVYLYNSILRSFFFKKASNSVREKSCYWYILNKKKLFPDNFTYAQKNTFLFYFYKAIENVKPPLESRSLRFGGSNRQIPATVTTHRQWGYAIRWIIEAAENLKNSKTSFLKLEKNLPKRDFGAGKKETLLKKNKISGKTFPFFCFFLAEALLQAYYNRGSAIEKRNLWIENAISNRAFLRYRWW